MKRYAFTFLIFLVCWTSQAQTVVNLKRSGRLTLEEIDGKKIQKLIDDVWLVQGNTNIYCDSAYLDKLSNSAEAFGHVRIIDDVDSLDISSDYLQYDGNTRLAYLERNVILKDDSSTLYTDDLVYNRDLGIGEYKNGGRLVDDLNTLTSLRGEYYRFENRAVFYDSVSLVNEEFTLNTIQLEYNTETEVSITQGQTIGISSDGDTLKTAVGLIYDRNNQNAQIFKGSIKNDEFFIKGDTLIANDKTSIYEAFYNAEMESFADSLTIYGDQTTYNKLEKTAYAYKDAFLRKMIEGDSLFISGDTLYSNQKDEGKKFLTVYHNALMFKSDMQGAADSVTYNFSDSTINMYKDPIIWTNDSQIAADSIDIILKSNKIDRMELSKRSFVISKDSTDNYNQVSGINMFIHFEDGFMRKTEVVGNGESIYFIIDKSGALSMNKIQCSDMSLYFKGNTVEEIRFYTEVDGQVIPEPEILATDRQLRGFDWQADRKPKYLEVAKRYRYDR